MEPDATVLNGDYAYVARIAVSSIADGVTPWDANDEPGNDSGVGNKIVRTFDTLTYNFNVAIDTYGTDKTYTEARVRLEFVLPLTEDQACFNQAAMAWMDMTSGYEPKLTTETHEIGGEQIQCQVLTCYKHLLPSGTHSTAAPGEFGENVTVNVKSMKNGDTFAPIFSAAMEYNTWDGKCTEHAQAEKKTIVADEIKVSATPKYNIKIDGQSSYKSTFDFNTGNEKAPNQGIGQVSGRVMKMGVILQLYNDNASKGIKGIELPDGSPITFDIEVGSQYTINTDNSPSGKPQGTKVDTSDVYTPLLWSCDGNLWTTFGEKNSDDRVLYEPYGCAQNMAPYNRGGGENACNDGGEWKATQEGTTIHVTVSGYQIDVDKMPIRNADEGDIFMIRVLDETLTYEVDQIRIVEPYEMTALEIEKGKDYCTLVTCTPYGINTHRLLVRGRRVDNQEGAKSVRVTADAMLVEPMLVASLAAIPMLLLLLIAMLMTHRRKK